MKAVLLRAESVFDPPPIETRLTAAARGHGECLANGYGKTQFGSDAEWVADLYRQLGRESRGEVYEQISRAAEAIDAGKPAVVDNRNLAIFACMDFYEGAQLKALIRKASATRKR